MKVSLQVFGGADHNRGVGCKCAQGSRSVRLSRLPPSSSQTMSTTCRHSGGASGRVHSLCPCGLCVGVYRLRGVRESVVLAEDIQAGLGYWGNVNPSDFLWRGAYGRRRLFPCTTCVGNSGCRKQSFLGSRRQGVVLSVLGSLGLFCLVWVVLFSVLGSGTLGPVEQGCALCCVSAARRAP
jgi:hypothetical protein